MISKEEVEHIAKLARLELTGKETEKMQKDLTEILGYFDLLKNVPEIVKNNDSLIDEKEILKHCRVYLSPYKVPREVEFVEAIIS